tara:strand:+ start:21583 stop:21747 length:165 start_codon:yes stop_codon:yes gene_type:complete
MNKSKSNTKNSKKCCKCGDTEDLWYEPMVMLGIGKPDDYILCGHCLNIEYDDEI